jgi:hypothetical protein
MQDMSKVCWLREETYNPLQPVVVEENFEQWGLDIIGEINTHSSR